MFWGRWPSPSCGHVWGPRMSAAPSGKFFFETLIWGPIRMGENYKYRPSLRPGCSSYLPESCVWWSRKPGTQGGRLPLHSRRLLILRTSFGVSRDYNFCLGETVGSLTVSPQKLKRKWRIFLNVDVRFGVGSERCWWICGFVFYRVSQYNLLTYRVSQ